ncbi:MAG: DUF721 domain-containing protein [Saprospirales bacterium]|nr:MAG: DUF721 domain-containing protein [Saprospirales bacterium]
MMFKKSNEQKLGDILKQFSSKRKIKPGYDQYRVKKWWHENMGGMINEQTSGIYLKHKALYISVSSASLRSELNMSRDALREKINRELDGEVVEKIIVR